MSYEPATIQPAGARVNDPAHDNADRRWSEMKKDRAPHEATWEDIARLIRPQRGGFMQPNSAERVLEKPLSSAPIMAQSNFAAGLYGTLTNPANRWFGFRTNDPDLNAHQPARLWMDKVTDRVLASFMPGISPFYSATTEAFSDLSAFGNAAQYDELVTAEKKILDVTISLAEICYDIDGWGRICEVVRKFYLKPAAALRMFGADALPKKFAEQASAGAQDKHVFYHHVTPNDAFQPGRIGPKGKRWLSRYTTECERCLVREAGYDEMPFYAPRWEVDSGQIYGIGPGYVALASTRVHHQMEMATIRAAQRAADPTLLAPDRSDWPLNGKIRPGQVVYGGLNMQGNQMLRPLDITGQINLTLQDRQLKMEEIKDAFHYSLMSLAGRTGMTATEVMTITEERQRLWAPHQGRVQQEFLAPKISRRFALLWRAGQIPPPPDGMAGAALEVVYQSAAAAAQRSVEGNAALRVIQDLAPLMQIEPRIADRIDPDGLIEVLGDARGAPAKMFRSREDADALAQQRDQMQQMAATMGAMQQGAGALKDAASAAQALQPAQGQGGRP